ncbi:MAG: SLC13 family permease, partial [Chloroflexota bacterium]
KLKAGDKLIVKGKLDEFNILKGLQELIIEEDDSLDISQIETDNISLTEIILSPRTSMAGKTLRTLNFREKFGVSVLGIWRNGRAYRHNLRDMLLRFGDTMLVHGNYNKLSMLAMEPDFIVLDKEIQAPLRPDKAPTAVLIMVGVVLIVGLGLLPIAIAVLAGATLMILTNCINMDEAYRAIEWQAVFLIAGMLPLGTAMENSGTARFLADGILNIIDANQLPIILISLFVITLITSQIMPNPVVMVLMAPIAMNATMEAGASPYAVMMTIALAASSTFLSPIGHPANVLIMGPGGYRFKDYIKVGLPLTLIISVVVFLFLPLIWPLY